MKKNNHYIFLLFITFNLVYSQKKDIYLNDNLETISKKEYKKDNSIDNFLKLKIDIDTAFINVKVNRFKKGKISNTLLDSIKSNLNISAEYFNENNIIVINYFPGIDNCNLAEDKNYLTIKHKKYLREINEYKNVKQFFICNTFKGTEKYGRINWIEDKNSLFKTNFFPIHYPCRSFVLIDSKGNYYAYRGDYNIDNQGNLFYLLKNPETFMQFNYFDENYKPLNYEDFLIKKRGNKLLSVKGDSINHKILSKREIKGFIPNKKELNSILSNTIKEPIDELKVQVIFFYPNIKSFSSSSCLECKRRESDWHITLEEKLYKSAKTKPIFIYKNNDDLSYSNDINIWHKDESGLIEKALFKNYDSFVNIMIISKEGKFIYLIGEHCNEDVLKAVRKLK